MNSMTRTRRLTWRRKAVALVAALQMIFCQASPLFALPQGERVAGGDVSFTRQGDSMTILQTSRRAIVNYDSFSIGSPETVQFVQPDSSAAILNRVAGNEGSVIAGIMLANGNVYLINPNGILFTSSAKINVGSLFASALDISDDDFASGRLLFSGGSGSVVNKGEITAADRVCLFGGAVENSGTIRAGNVLMAAASTSVEIDNAAGGAIRLIVDGKPLDESSTAGSQAQNSSAGSTAPTQSAGTAGQTLPPAPATDPATSPTTSDPANPGQMPAAAGAAVAQDAATAGMVINQGTVSASGNSGGTVAMSGTRVGQFGIVHADGSSGDGGVITIIAADTVALGETSVTTANAGLNGNGGTVIVVSPGSALFRRGARIEAKGGSETGNGGFIEVSGHTHVEIFGTANASADNGKAGTFLIDPSDVTLRSTPPYGGPYDGDWIPSGGPPYNLFIPSVDSAVADIGVLQGSLKNTDVVITTSPVGTLLGDITVADPIDLDGTDQHQLTLLAHNNILVNANIADLVPGTPDKTTISLRTMGGTVIVNALIDTGGGNLSITAVGDVGLTAAATVATHGGSFASSGKNFTSAPGATITIGGGIGEVNLTHSGTVSINDTIDTAGGTGKIIISGNSIALNPNSNPYVLRSANAIELTTGDIAITGGVLSPSVTIEAAPGVGIDLGCPPVPGRLNVSGAELAQIATSALKLYSPGGSIKVDGILPWHSLAAGTVTLDAGTSISFENTDSTFQALVAKAKDGITVDANRIVETLTGDLSLDGNTDNIAGGNILFGDSVQLKSAGTLTLDATTGGIASQGALALVANNGVTINDSLSGPPAAGILTIRADNDANGNGKATIAAGVTINEFTGSIQISADDLSLGLGASLRADSILIAESHGGGIGLGDTARGMTISGSTLQKIITPALELHTDGSITVNHILESDSPNVAVVTLSAGNSISFAYNDSKFQELVAKANNGISFDAFRNIETLNGDLSLDGNANGLLDGVDNIDFGTIAQLDSAGSINLTAASAGMIMNGHLTLNADKGININSDLTTISPTPWAILLEANADRYGNGIGEFKVASGATIGLPAAAVQIVADDVDIGVGGNIQGAEVWISDSDGTGIGLGTPTLPVTGELNIDGGELRRIFTPSLSLYTPGSIRVNGISPTDSSNAGAVTLTAGTTIFFEDGSSTFQTLAALADNGIDVRGIISTDPGYLQLDGNTDHNLSGGILFHDGAQLASASYIVLDAAGAGMTSEGALTLTANGAVIINNNLSGPPAGGVLIISADKDIDGFGAATIAADATISRFDRVEITADDLYLYGSLSAGSVRIAESHGGGIGLGETAGGMTISDSTLQKIITPALELHTDGSITVDKVPASGSLYPGAVTLSAGASVDFKNNPSAFNSLTALADNGISVLQDLTTVTGSLSLDGDADDTTGVNDNIWFAPDVCMSSAGSMTLRAKTSGMTGAGALTLDAKDGILIENNLTTAGTTTLNTDSDGAGGGDLTVAAGATINTAGNTLLITANDIVLPGNLQGSGITVTDSDGDGIGLGATAVVNGLNIDDGELGRIAAPTLELDTAGAIIVHGIDNLSVGAVTLDSKSDISFKDSDSTFQALVATAGKGIDVLAGISTSAGNMSLDGDSNDTADGNDWIRFADGMVLNSAGSLALKARTGDMTGEGTLTLNANNGITILDDLTTAGDLAANDNTTVADGVALRAGADLTVADGSWVRGDGALGMSSGNHMTLGGDVTSAGAMNLLADSNGDGVGLLRIKGNVSTDGAVPDGTITLVGEIQVDGSMTVGAPDLSLAGADRNDVDYSIMAPIHAGGIIIRMGHSIYDGTAGESSELLARNVSLAARTGSIGGSGAADIDTAASTLNASARGNIYIEEADNVRIAGGVRGGGSVGLNIHGSLAGDSVSAGGGLSVSAGRDIDCSRLSAGASADLDARGGLTADSVSAGNRLTVSAGGGIACGSLSAGALMDLDGASLTFDTLTAHSVDADIGGGIAMGRATLADLADFKAGGTISDHNSMITAHDVYLIAGGNVGGSAINLDVDRISLITAGGLVHIRQHAQGDTPLGLISAGDHFEVEVLNGGLTDGNGAGLNFRARNDSYLALHGTCGGLCSPLQIEIDPGHLHVNGINISGADTPDGWVWISLEGTLGRDPVTSSQIEYTGNVEIPGLVLFNGAAVLGDKTVMGDLFRTEAFSVETPELKSRQGVFGSPYFLHTYMNISEPIALGVADYLIHGLAYVNADPEFPSIAKQRITMWPKGYSW